MKNRIDSLDWLRGLLAVSILLYHIISWETGKLGSSSFLGKLGVYGVSMFFVLSGLSMALVYSHYIKDVRTSVFFFIRRIVRIWPLMWFAVFSSVFIAFLAGNRYPISKIVLNITTLFGFVNHSASTINTGAWSIGNEMVYYSLTPFILILYNWRKWCGNIVLLASVVLAVYFSGYAMDSSSSLGAQWGIYKNPFNNFFLYCAGIALYY
ncbi:acyltransferase, partial [Myxococcota bacterium]|nr:acyltransferase [Myxococcota bacterium]